MSWTQKIPDLPKNLPILLTTNAILLPGCVKVFSLNDSKNKGLISHVLKNGKESLIIGVTHTTEIGTIATAASIHKFSRSSCLLTGIARFYIDSIKKTEPYIVAGITQIDKQNDYQEIKNNPQIIQLTQEVRQALFTLLGSDASSTVINESANQIPDRYLPEIFSHLLLSTFDEQLKLLYTLDMSERLKQVLARFKDPKNAKRPRVVVRSMSFEDKRPEVKELEKRFAKIKFSAEVNKVIKRDLDSLKRIHTYSPEFGVLHGYLSVLADLPWNKVVEETLDLPKVKHDLEVDHYGLEKVKERILEYLAVRKLRNYTENVHKGPILCLVGPPGVGKTSIARSIASTLNRPFERVSLGGVSNMADIRGHRRTYVASMPGRIIQAIKRSGVKNPLILLDEIDKMTIGLHGNPAAALLEVLDPSQNKDFVDHYLNVPFDLSQVMFIATANSIKNLSPALYDRLEMIRISGYTYLEKIQIFINHLLPKQLIENGLSAEQIYIPEDTIQLLVNNYTREAGVRELDRKLGSLCRSVAVKIALNENNDGVESLPVVIDIDSAKAILGPVLWENNKWSSRLGRPGVAVGLVVSDAGGNTLAVESSFMPGSGKLTLTGSLGDVIKESAQLAWGWVRANANLYGVELDGKRLQNMDVHIHFPEGAVNKDGPSAGVTIATTLMSLFLDRPLLPNFAMTGEITLQGLVLPVGGIKEKVIAAHKDGFTKIILPQQNAKNLHDIPANIKDQVQFILVSDMHTIMETVFENGINLLESHCPKAKL